MCPRTRDIVAAKIASRLNSSMSRDERVVHTLLGCKAQQVPDRLLLVSTPYVRRKVTSKLSKSVKKGRVFRGKYNDVMIGVVDVGIGTPSAALAVEGIVRTSPQAMVRTDFCGGLAKQQGIGDTVLVNQVIPGDGTTVAYFGPDQIQAHGRLNEHILSTAERLGLKLQRGVMWTTDTLMLQTEDLLESWKEKSAVAVDMESSILLGLGKHWNVPAASLNCVSDKPLHGKGLFESERVDPNLLTGLERTINLGLQALISWASEE
jgi:AMP nucleosidase